MSTTELEEIIEDLASDPVMFVETMLNVKPEKWQKEFLYNVQNNPRNAVKSGHGVGKTAVLSWLILWWLLTRHPCKVICTANTAHQLSDVLWAEVKKWGRQLPEAFYNQLEMKNDKINLEGASDSYAVARVSRRENPEALQGFHSDNLLFIIDEASGVDDMIFEVGEGSLSTPNAKVVMTGNPTRTSGYFFNAFSAMRDRWKLMTVACADSSQVSDAYIEDMSLKYGDDSNVYRVRVLGEFPRAEDDTVIPLYMVDSALQRDIQVDPYTPVVWGLDVAAFGSDRTALCKRRGNEVTEPIKSWQGKDLMETVGLIVQEYEMCSYKDRPTDIMVDSIGIGSGVCSRLTELDLPARPIQVSESPSMREKYMRLRDELWFKAREWFEGRDVYLVQDDKLIEELIAPRFKFTSNGKVKVEAKDEFKKRLGGRSCDLADAFCLTFAQQSFVASVRGTQHNWNKPIQYKDNSWIT